MKLALERVGHSFLGRTIFEDINLSLGKGEVVALLGPSGCGKTTILQIAAGIIPPSKGRVVRNYRKHAVAFQEHRLLPWLTARDNIAYGCRMGGEKLSSGVIEQRALEVGLQTRDLDKYPAELSGGMCQRVAVARALAVNPEIVFFDEPFSAVDVGLRRTLQDLVIETAMRDGFSALFVTHDLTEAVRIAHRLAILSEVPGKPLLDRRISGSPGERSERAIFELVEEWSHDRAFRELFDGQRELRQ